MYKERKTKGEYYTLVREAMLFDSEFFFRMFRMSSSQYEELLGFVGPRLLRVNARREPISTGERLSVTLRYLVSGDAFSTIATSYRLSETTVGRIVKDTCSALLDVLYANGYLLVPSTAAEWVEKS